MPAMQALFTLDVSNDLVPGRTISLDQILHGEHYIEFLNDVPTEGKLVSTASVVEVLDKGSGAVIVYNSKFIKLVQIKHFLFIVLLFS